MTTTKSADSPAIAAALHRWQSAQKVGGGEQARAWNAYVSTVEREYKRRKKSRAREDWLRTLICILPWQRCECGNDLPCPKHFLHRETG